METNDLIRRAEDLAARCERTSSVTATAFLTPAERMELQNTPSLRGTAVVYSGGGTECERTCAFFLPFYLTAEELDPSEYISAVHFRSFFGEPGHRDYLGALLALGVRREWVGDIRIRGAEAWVFCLPSVVKTLAELDRAGRYTVRGEKIALADVPEEEVKTETVSFTVQSLRLDAVTAGLFHVSRTTAAELIRLGSVSLNYVPCLHTDAAIRDLSRTALENTLSILHALEQAHQEQFSTALTLRRLGEALYRPRLPDRGRSLRYDLSLPASACLEDDLLRLDRIRMRGGMIHGA